MNWISRFGTSVPFTDTSERFYVQHRETLLGTGRDGSSRVFGLTRLSSGIWSAIVLNYAI